MTSMSKGSVWMAAFTLAVIASIGSYLGYNKATAAPGGDTGAGEATATLAAKTAKPIPDGAATPVPDEAFIRKIAQDEIQTALHPKHAAVAKSNDDNADDDSSDDHGPVVAAPPTAAAVYPRARPGDAHRPLQPAAPPPPPPTGLHGKVLKRQNQLDDAYQARSGFRLVACKA